ncbi:MAG TPA: DUF1800 family protein [Candidatus Polarisedimenticolaceae bacterium]|nr:DUF1800 family protein [Candidatus Polarisedimenticolaceae bacterium]
MLSCRGSRLGGVLLLVAACASGVQAETPREASRFLAQATLGADWQEIQRTANLGFPAWLDEQFARPLGYQQPMLDERARVGLELTADHRRWSWWQQVMRGPDPLRQRVALALSEIFVVSDNLGEISENPRGLANYYDTLLRDAFGNYRDLLRDVTLHPIMGVYLSHLRNERSSGGRFPDENYAREVMQLFSIGLFRLHPDGSYVLDGQGRPIPTYDNDDITEFAKIFTGLAFAGSDFDFHEGQELWTAPMRMYDAFHEPGPKHLLRGRYVPAGQTGMQDVDDAIDDLFQHPNVGPFIGRKLIQRLVTSNPSRAYLARVSAAFADNGAGVRGDLRAVVRAILLDPEARRWPQESAIGEGMLRESFLRRVHLARAFDAANLVGSYPIDDGGAPTDFSQRPLSSPTVFNFFLPDYQPAGPIADAGLVAPEFQIITAVTAITSANALQSQVESAMNGDPNDALEVRLDLDEEIAIAADPRALVDRLDLLLLYGNMSQPMREVLLHALEQRTDPVERAELAVYLISISPEYVVVK